MTDRPCTSVSYSTAPIPNRWPGSCPKRSATPTSALPVPVALYLRQGNGPKLLLQRITEPKTAKNRMHLDIETPDIETPDIEREAIRLIGLGAQRVDDSKCSEHR